MLALAYDVRYNKKKDIDKKEMEKNELFIQKLNDDRKSITQEINERLQKVIRENEEVAEILQEICYSPFIQHTTENAKPRN